MVKQIEITLPPFSRGAHLITKHITKHLSGIDSGIAHIFIKHTSASLAINENADPSVRVDAEYFFNQIVPDGYRGFTHTLEGSDDMPAHIKNMLIGSSLSFPITNGKPNLGTWQGIYLFEHRNYGGSRNLVITIIGE
jgi:secondary thiamine-phosphate synthase enzyme